MKPGLLCFFPALAFLLALSAAEIVIKPENSVISYYNSRDRIVAFDLKKHLDLIFSSNIPVTSDGKPPEGKFVFHVGKLPPDAKAEFKPEEARWLATPEGIYFYGDRNSGSRHAVYNFLEDELGVRWPEPGEIMFIRPSPIVLGKVSGAWTPPFRVRGIRGRDPEYRLWCMRMCFGGHDQPQVGHAFTDYWEKFGKTNPEFFALNSSGKRAPALKSGNDTDNPAAFHGKNSQAVKMCVSSEALHRKIVEKWNFKEKRYINICENDSPPIEFCSCENCRKLDPVRATLGNYYPDFLTDRYVYFANAVAKLAVAKRPDARVCYYAYNETERPPVRERISANHTIGIVPTVFTVEGTEKLLSGWKKAGATEFFWRPNQHTYFNSGCMPFGFEKHFFNILCLTVKHGTIGFDYSSFRSHPTLSLSDYVLAKGMKDPSRNYEYWLDHYCSAFGESAPYVKEYHEYWRRNWEKRIAPHLDEILKKGRYYNFVRGMMWGELAKSFEESDFDATDKILETALSGKLSDSARGHIAKMLLANKHARLVYRSIALKSDENSLALLKFREKNNIPILFGREEKWGDPCEIKTILALREYDPPFIRTNLFWYFKLDPSDTGVKEKWFEASVKTFSKNWDGMLPTDSFWENPPPRWKQVSPELRGKLKNYDGTGWYATGLKVPAEWKNRDVYLYFGAVDESCWIYVNGKEVGKHIFKNSYDWTVPFGIRINDGITNWDSSVYQNIIVRVEDKAGMGGIWKRVWLVSKAGK
ncbi:MAG: beta-D-glucuronidase [Lentisphaerae bacterium ADurb.Bin242]|nr:MAG: beta-D-glucuronidase [Lentisphaerae bacterium ADurb.Bin242]